MSESTGKPSREQLSKTPSWIMLGFVFGCVFALTIKHELDTREEAAAGNKNAANAASAHAQATTPANNVTALKDRPSLAAIEDIFTDSSASAKWDSGLTEIALWNPTTGRYSDYFEVLQSEGHFYFRTISHLTRPAIDPEQNRLKAILFTGPQVPAPTTSPLLKSRVAPPDFER